MDSRLAPVTPHDGRRPVSRVPLIKPDLPDLDDVAEEFREILGNGRVTNFGKYMQQFEKAASDYLDVPVATVSSGTMGLVFALQAAGLEAGESVLLPSFTFTATAQAVIYAGGVPSFVDVGSDLTLATKDLEEALSRVKRVGAVVPVHTFGQPARVDEIAEMVAAYKRPRRVPIVYDSAHAFGATVAGQRVGCFGDAEVFSLSATKTLVSVEGGLVSSRSEELIERIQRMRNYGIEADYDTWWPGLNGKMSEFHAIVGFHNLRRLEDLLERRHEMAAHYRDQITSLTDFEVIATADDTRHTFKDFAVLTPSDLASRRDEIQAILKERGIETKAYFDPPLHEQRLFKRYVDRSLPNTEDIARRVICLPFFTTISDQEIDHVVDALIEASRGRLQ